MLPSGEGARVSVNANRGLRYDRDPNTLVFRLELLSDYTMSARTDCSEAPGNGHPMSAAISGLDIVLFVYGAGIGLPHAVLGMFPRRSRNMRKLSLLLGASGLLAAASSGAHLAHWPVEVRGILLAASIGALVAWLLVLVSLARHNTSM